MHQTVTAMDTEEMTSGLRDSLVNCLAIPVAIQSQHDLVLEAKGLHRPVMRLEGSLRAYVLAGWHVFYRFAILPTYFLWRPIHRILESGIFIGTDQKHPQSIEQRLPLACGEMRGESMPYAVFSSDDLQKKIGNPLSLGIR